MVNGGIHFMTATTSGHGRLKTIDECDHIRFNPIAAPDFWLQDESLTYGKRDEGTPQFNQMQTICRRGDHFIGLRHVVRLLKARGAMEYRQPVC